MLVLSPVHPVQVLHPQCPWADLGTLLGASDPFSRRVVLATRNGLELRGVLMRSRPMRRAGVAAGGEEARVQHPGEELIL